jgi:hypothetical protein
VKLVAIFLYKEIIKIICQMLTELDILKDVIKKFETLGIQYMLTGSMAMTYYAQPRMTRDIDLVVEILPGFIGRIEYVFKNEYHLSAESIKDAIDKEFMFNLIHINSAVKIDCIVRKNQKYRLVEFDRRNKIKVDDLEIFIVSIEDLIISKLLWAKDSHSEMQIKDVRNLLAKNYDKKYIELWAKELDIYELLTEIKND